MTQLNIGGNGRDEFVRFAVAEMRIEGLYAENAYFVTLEVMECAGTCRDYCLNRFRFWANEPRSAEASIRGDVAKHYARAFFGRVHIDPTPTIERAFRRDER